MTTLHATIVGDKTMLPKDEFERLVELAERSEEITLLVEEDDLPTVGLMKLADQGGAFEWLAEEDDLYTVDDLKVR